MDFWRAVRSGFSNYANFKGRAARSEFWYWQLFLVIAGLAVELLDLAISFGVFAIRGGPMSILFWLATLVPNLALYVRRLHDTNRSGWWLLILPVPAIGVVMVIAWFCFKGTKGYNRFGADPIRPEVSLHGAGRSLHGAIR
jgi:uncharacterized membrane protein YhaH (DUF805 family)